MTAPVRCHFCNQPPVYKTPGGYDLCQDHYDSAQQALHDMADREPWVDWVFGTQPEDPEEPEGPQPVDLRALMSGEPLGAEWLVDPILPAGKLVALVAKRGDGKSLLLLDVIANLCTGNPTLHQPQGEPKHGLYLDMEMGPDDLYDRLSDLGWTNTHPDFDALAEHLHYYQLPSLPALDTPEGGEALEALVDRHHPEIVVIDTISRVVGGNENDAEPYRDLYRNTELRLKRRRITLARLDHLGKDPGKGSRGSSAKEDPMDVVWQLALSAAGQLVLTLTKGRQGWIPRSVTIYRDDIGNGLLKHTIHVDPEPDWLQPLIANIDELGQPPDTSVNKTFTALKTAGKGANRARVSLAVRTLRQRKTTPQGGTGKAGTTLFDPNGYHSEYHPVPPEKVLEEATQKAGTTPGTASVPLVPGVPPPRGGYHPGSQPKPAQEMEEPSTFDDDFEPDPDDLPDPF